MSYFRRIGSLATVSLALALTGCGLGPLEEPRSATVPTEAAAQTDQTGEPRADEPRSVTLTLAGDLLWHPSLYHGAAIEAGGNGYEFGPLFADVAPLLGSADLLVCHQEVPLIPADEEPSGYPAFGAPAEVAAGIAEAGWQMCTTASNHSLDRGINALYNTVSVLEDQDVAVVGTYTDVEDAQTPVIVETEEGIKVSVVTGTYGLNGIAIPAGHEHAVDMLDTQAMIARAEAAKEAGADIVLAAIHAGDEYVTEPNEQQVQAATALANSDAVDMVYGHHNHVIQPWDRINGKLVIYGLGNFVAQQATDEPRTYEGALAEVTFVEKDGEFELTEASYTPTFVTKSQLADDLSGGITARVLQINKALEDGFDPSLVDQERLEIAKSRIHDAVHFLGIDGIEEN